MTISALAKRFPKVAVSGRYASVKLENVHVTIKRVRTDDDDFVCLINALSEMLAELNGEKNDYYAPLNTASSLAVALVAYVESVPVGCGGFRIMDDGAIEIKRMFVLSEQRGVGIGKALLSEIESIGREHGHSRIVLETSKRLPAATGLYQISGYTVIPNYGPYIGLDDSICMEKILA